MDDVASDRASRDLRDPLTVRVIGLAIEVHRALGPGLLESIYEDCLCYELEQHRIAFERQVCLPVIYKSMRLENAYRLDVVVERKLVVELKTVERLLPIHEAQLLTYLRGGGYRTGLLLNFYSVLLKDGIKRMVA
jgi:GxxExxY protein